MMSSPLPMMTPRNLFFCAVILIAFGYKSAAEDIQKAAETLLERSRKFSDIRAQDAPAFLLKVTFSFRGNDLETLSGTYTETWISDSQWRRETMAGKFRRIEVGGPKQRWLVDGGNDFPEQLEWLPDLVGILPTRAAKLEFDSITDSDPATRCVITKGRGEEQARHAFCFDRSSGFLVAHVTPEILTHVGTGPSQKSKQNLRIADYSCNYEHFLKFGDYWFPREIDCFEDKHPKLEAKVADLSLLPVVDSALFIPPAGALEIGNCTTNLVPPQPSNAREPVAPMGLRDRHPIVALWMVVDTKGKPQGLKISRSAGKQFDDAALAAVGSWQFKPGTCDGKTMALPIGVEIGVWRYLP